MVTRIDKSSITRTPEYMLQYRLRIALGDRLVDRALRHDLKALDRIEEFAWHPRKKPALVRWVNHLRKVAQNDSRTVSSQSHGG